MNNNQTLWDLIYSGIIEIDDLVGAVDAYLDDPLMENYYLGGRYLIKLSHVVRSHENAVNAAELKGLHPPERRTIVRSALLMATPVEL